MKESFEIKYDIVPYTRGKVLELGSDGYRMYPHFITVDEGAGEGWKPDIISPLNKLDIIASQSVDAVLSSHIINNPKIGDKIRAIKEWWRVLKQGGYLVLHFPNNGMQKEIIDIMKGGGSWDLCVSEPKKDAFIQVYHKTGSTQTFSYAKPAKEKTCAITRYGGFGDMLIASPIFEELKLQGYSVVVYTSPYAYEVVKEDPNVDEFVLQDKNQVPNEELPFFWEHIKSKYDKFINLSESLEAALLAISGRMTFEWSNEVRDLYMGHNYYDFANLVSGVKPRGKPKFYATEKEKKWAARMKKKIGGRIIMWVLAGSSVHKMYPHMDQVIARFMLEEEDVKVVFVGNQICKLLEDPWREEKRVVRLSGEVGIRETMALAEICDVVVTPETGVAHAVAFEETPTVVMLSHSSVENITRDWKNTTSLVPEGCPCYPCHKMIYGFEHCTRDEKTGAALCQASIDPENVISVIRSWI